MLDRLWKKCEPWLGSTSMDGSVASTITRAPATWPHETGTPSHGSELPHRPNPISRYGRPASTSRRFIASTWSAMARVCRASNPSGFT